jgi:hypothetical protein
MREIVHIQMGLIAAATIVTTMMAPQQDETDAAPDPGSVAIVSNLAAQPADD